MTLFEWGVPAALWSTWPEPTACKFDIMKRSSKRRYWPETRGSERKRAIWLVQREGGIVGRTQAYFRVFGWEAVIMSFDSACTLKNHFLFLWRLNCSSSGRFKCKDVKLCRIRFVRRGWGGGELSDRVHWPGQRDGRAVSTQLRGSDRER